MIMKRIDAYIPTIKRRAVIKAIIKAGAEGVTIIESRGRGPGKRPMIGGIKGITRYIAEYNRIDYITTVVENSKVNEVVNMIIKTAHTGSKGDGKIFVYPVEESYDISTKKRAGDSCTG